MSQIPSPLQGVPVLLIATALALPSCAVETGHAPSLGFSGTTMGTSYVVKARGLPKGATARQTQREIEQVLSRINARMSTYRPDSEISRFNRASTTDWVTVSAETAQVVQLALGVSRLTDGAFDITVGPLVQLWGFGSSERARSIPPDRAVAEVLERVGYERVHVRRSPPAIRKELSGIEIDLSAIAKGYAVDQVAEQLELMGASDYLVEIGGEVRVKGRNQEGHQWKIAIEQPVPEVRAPLRVLLLDDQALATSGGYRNYFEVDGRRFSHTIDPNTGYPVRHNLASVSVITDSCVEADALATGLMVLGPEAGYQLAKRRKIASLFVSNEPEGFQQRATPELTPFVAGEGGMPWQSI